VARPSGRWSARPHDPTEEGARRRLGAGRASDSLPQYRYVSLIRLVSLHGHTYALDAIVAATALASPAPMTILTSDPEDLLTLCGPSVRVIKV
jgi:hypothetical protein